ncbi:MAG: hypothetical protein HY722_03485 [Planctomycetes bacterium]|nr:hypothetical protein [Planctomycetota bacterium]
MLDTNAIFEVCVFEWRHGGRSDPRGDALRDRIAAQVLERLPVLIPGLRVWDWWA